MLAEIERLAKEKIGWTGRLEPSMRLVEDLRLDSIRNLALAVEIENHFRISIEEEEEDALVSVGALVEVVVRKLRQGSG